MPNTSRASAGSPKPATIHNAEIVDAFYRLAELLEIEGANPFRVRAYRNAARTISELPESVAAIVEAGADLTELPGIGEDLAGKVVQFVTTGHLKALEQEERKLPRELVEMATLPGLGPKRIKLLHDRLKINNLKDLQKAATAGKLGKLPHFGAKLEEKILQDLQRRTKVPKRMLLVHAEEIGQAFVNYLKADKDIDQVVIAGSFRRRKDTVGDLDILVTSAKPTAAIALFTAYPEVKQVVSKGPTRSTILLHSGLQVDLRVVPEQSYGAALHYFTGSKLHNIAIRRMGMKHGFKISEYGVFKGTKRIAGRTEAEVYHSIELPYIEPELREDRGELEAAREHRLPRLVTIDDIRGDLHVHTKASDGRMTIEEMARAAKRRGYAYIAITDHTKHVTVAHGLNEKQLARQIAEIERINARLKGIRILKSAEVDILEDGRLDLPDNILKELDFTVCAVHYKFDMHAEKQTERIIRAMDNPYFNILAHPTGRLINKREGYAIDFEKIVRAARERSCFLELDAQPERLDLDDIHARLAKEAEVLIAINTDAHSAVTLDYMRFGIDQARRGWLEAKDVLNTRPWSELSRLFKRHK